MIAQNDLVVIRDDSSYFVTYSRKTKKVVVTQRGTTDVLIIPVEDLGALIGTLLSAQGAYYSDRLGTEAKE